MRRDKSAVFLIFLIFFSLAPPLEFRRGGGGLGGGRSGGGGFGRGASGARSGSSGGLFGGSRSSSSNAGINTYGRRTNIGGGGQSRSGIPPKNTNQGYNPGGYRGNNMNSQGKGGLFGGLFGRKQGSHSNTGYNTHGFKGGGLFGSSSWRSSGMGSRSRGSQFKNMIVGAAAGYLTYQAGKALIRAAAGPMMWNNRPYYWGSNYYRPSPGHTNMCRMPIDSSDPQFGNVYFEDQTRPREITWGCGYYEYCCGYECCRGGSSDQIGGRGSSIGFLLLILLGLLCAFPIVINYIRRRRFAEVPN